MSARKVNSVSVFGLGYVGCGDSLIVGSSEPEVADAIARARPEQLIIDLVRLPDAGQLRGSPNYLGIGW